MHTDAPWENPRSVTPTHSCGLRSLISATFHLAHYHDSNLSVSHTAQPFQPSNQLPHSLSEQREERGGTVFKRVFSAGPGMLRRIKPPQLKKILCDGTLSCKNGVRDVTEKSDSWLLIINSQVWTHGTHGTSIWNRVSGVVLQQVADYPITIHFLYGIWRLSAARRGSRRLATDYWVLCEWLQERLYGCISKQEILRKASLLWHFMNAEPINMAAPNVQEDVRHTLNVDNCSTEEV